VYDLVLLLSSFLQGLSKFEDGDSHNGDRRHISNSLWLYDMDTNKWYTHTQHTHYVYVGLLQKIQHCCIND